jgi:MoxR-like ATPase
MPKRWNVFQADQAPGDHVADLPEAPPWRRFNGAPDNQYSYPETSKELEDRGEGFRMDSKGVMARMVNAALCLRRPLLITGEPGTGKSSLIYAVAHQLKLGDVLKWPITSRSTLQQGLYQYDAIGRLQEAQMRLQQAQLRQLRGEPVVQTDGSTASDIGQFIRLGPLGTALLPTRRPRALLIDEIDKSDLDLPNDLLHVFEEGEFTIPELKRMKDEPAAAVNDHHGREVTIKQGVVRCHEFPFVVMTSNGEREFPAPFLRRCLRLDMPRPDEKMLKNIVESRLRNKAVAKSSADLIRKFLDLKTSRTLATDQLLNAVYLLRGSARPQPGEDDELIKALLRELRNEMPE